MPKSKRRKALSLTNPLVSILIPCSPQHSEVVKQAILSAQGQKAKVQIVVAPDENNVGAATLRNALLTRAQGEYVVFLDADDLLHHNFVSSCLEVIRPDTYVYTDHYERGVVKRNKYRRLAAWNIEHYITTLMPIDMARLGFDVTMPCMEDVEFYLRARKAGYRALYLPEALWTYRAEYGTSPTNRRDPHKRAAAIKAGEAILKQRFGVR